MFVQAMEGGVGGRGGVGRGWGEGYGEGGGLPATGVERECTCALQDLGLCPNYFLLASQPVKVTNEGWILLIGEQGVHKRGSGIKLVLDLHCADLPKSRPRG